MNQPDTETSLTSLAAAQAGRPGAGRLVHWLSSRIGGVRRRDVLLGTAVAATALATKPSTYALRPVSAYATICGPGNTASSGWTVFCATVNKGANACPPGSFAAGWWKAAGSSWCGGSYRYIVDCNASCSKCSSGCSDGICDSKCWSCSCGTGSTDTCDQRRVCCNAFRYGQCNTQIACSGGVHCRVVSCVPPYKWAKCTTTSLSADVTAEHSSPYLPAWGAISAKYHGLKEQGGWLGHSLGPVTSVGDGRGSFVAYSKGYIYDTATTAASAMTPFTYTTWMTNGGPAGALGYPRRDRYTGLLDAGWLQPFEKGCITDSASTATQVVTSVRWTVWQANGREGGVLGYPVAPVAYIDGGWLQPFQKGCITDSNATTTQVVHGTRWTVWQANGRETGPLGYPVAAVAFVDGGWIQQFQNGCITDSTHTTTQVVVGASWTAYDRLGRAAGVMGYPTAPAADSSGGTGQSFDGGALWGRAGGPAYAVRGAVLTTWLAAGGPGGSYGFPTGDTTQNANGTKTCVFEGGTITA